MQRSIAFDQVVQLFLYMLSKITKKEGDIMFYISKIKMKMGCYYSQKLTEIDQVYIDGQGFIKKGLVYDYLKENPNSIKVNRYP